MFSTLIPNPIWFLYNDFEFLEYSKSKIVEAKQMVEDGLSTVGLKALPSETNFMFIDLKDLNAENLRAAMADQGVLIRGIYRDYTNWSRVSMGKIADVQMYIDAIPEALEEIS